MINAEINIKVKFAGTQENQFCFASLRLDVILSGTKCSEESPDDGWRSFADAQDDSRSNPQYISHPTR